jgi:hypothetical protein
MSTYPTIDLEHKTKVPIDHPDGSVTNAKIADSTIGPAKLDAVNTPSDGQAPTYNAATGRFSWATAAGELSFMHWRISGRYHSSNLVGSTTTLSIAANYLYAWAFYVPTSTTFDRIGTYISTAATGSARLGIYADNGAIYPGSLVLDAGTVDTGTTGSKEITISVTLSPGLYWLALVSNASPAVGGITYTYCFAPMGHLNSYYEGANSYSVSYTYGTLPTTFPTGASSAARTVVVMLRKA